MNKDERREERRRSPRMVVDVPVRLTLGGRESMPGRLRDICRDAALVEVHRDCALGSEVSLMFELAEGEGPMQVAGQVIRLAPGDGDARAVAVLFRDLHPTAEGRIEMFLTRQG
jgi:hypothetical protein